MSKLDSDEKYYKFGTSNSFGGKNEKNQEYQFI